MTNYGALRDYAHRRLVFTIVIRWVIIIFNAFKLPSTVNKPVLYEITRRASKITHFIKLIQWILLNWKQLEWLSCRRRPMARQKEGAKGRSVPFVRGSQAKDDSMVVASSRSDMGSVEITGNWTGWGCICGRKRVFTICPFNLLLIWKLR